MSQEAVHLASKLKQITEHWSPRVVAELNDYQFKLAKLQGTFVWHSHADTDEAFLVLEGSLRIELRDGQVELGPGELYVVPRGVEHRPGAVGEECHVILLEPATTVNTGDGAATEFTVKDLEEI